MDLVIEEKELDRLIEKEQSIKKELYETREEIGKKRIEIECYKTGVTIGSKLIHRKTRVRVVRLRTRYDTVIAKCAVMKKDGTYGMKFVDVYIKQDNIIFDKD